MVLVFVMTMLMVISSGALAAEKPEYVIGWAFPNFGWVQYNDADQITGYKGFNLGFGYSSKTYYEPGVEMDDFNNYWGWGTLAFIVPYLNIGTDYAIPVNDHSFVTVGGEAGIVTIIPYVNFNLSVVF